MNDMNILRIRHHKTEKFYLDWVLIAGEQAYLGNHSKGTSRLNVDSKCL